MFDGVDACAHCVRDPRRAVRVRGDRQVPLVRLVDRGFELLERERRDVDLDPGREHAAGGDDLDRFCPGRHLLAHGLAQPVGAVDLEREQPVSVSSGDGERLTCRTDARASDDPLVDGSRHIAHRRTDTAEIAHGRHAARQVPRRVADRLDRGTRLGEPLRLAGEVGAAVEGQVHVAVDQSGSERVAVPLDLLRGARVAWRARVRTDPGDRAVRHEDAGSRAYAPAVEHGDVREVRRHYAPPRARPAACRNGDCGGWYCLGCSANSSSTRLAISSGVHRSSFESAATGCHP